VQAERELGQAILEIVQETIRIMPVLEAWLVIGPH
jgi:hypothetical protein